MRRYIGAWRAALRPAGAQAAPDPFHLLSFDRLASLSDILDASYTAILDQLRPALDADLGDADEDVLAAFAVAFDRLSLALLMCMTGHSEEAILRSIERLAPVLEDNGQAGPARSYAFRHPGFADHLRLRLPQAGRDWDVRAAERLASIGDADPLVYDYNARYRWRHLLRGLDLVAALDRSASARAQLFATPIQSIILAQLQERDPISGARLLRDLAAHALAPEQEHVAGGWAAAISALRAAERILRHARALAPLKQRGWRVEADERAPAELIELERTLIALGDAYNTIARRMDIGAQQLARPVGVIGWTVVIWNAIARLPVTIYLLLILLVNGVVDQDLLGLLQNLGAIKIGR